MKTIALTPYPGVLYLAKDRIEYRGFFKKATGKDTEIPKSTVGRTQQLLATGQAPAYLVFATGRPTLVHELSHVVLMLFGDVGIDPRKAGGEPFCYLLAHLFQEAGSK